MLSSREILISNNDREFLSQSLSLGLRLDGRSPFDFRTVAVKFGTRSGTVEASLGQTRVLACVSAELTEPYPDRPNEGFLHFSVDFSPIASPFFDSHTSFSDRSVEISRSLEKSIKESRCIDTEALCVVSGKRVWGIRVDLHFLDSNGNLTDCAHLAAVTALAHFRRPDVTVIGDRVTVHGVQDRQPVPLSLHHYPLAVSFAFFGSDGESYIVDPSLKEELTARAFLTLSMNIHKEVCYAQKNGGVGISPELIIRCSQIASARVAELTQFIKDRLKEDEDLPHNRVFFSMPNSKPKAAVKEEEKEQQKEKVSGINATSGITEPVNQKRTLAVKAESESELSESEEMDEEENDRVIAAFNKKRGAAMIDSDEEEEDAMEEFNRMAKEMTAANQPKKGAVQGKNQSQTQQKGKNNQSAKKK